MAKYKPLTFKERSIIQSMLNERYKLSSIANTFEKSVKIIHMSQNKNKSLRLHKAARETCLKN